MKTAFIAVAWTSWLVMAGPAHAAQPAPDAPGPWDVGRVTFEVVDASRDDRALTVDVWYPVDAADAAGVAASLYDLLFAAIVSPLALDEPPVSAQGPFPLIVFSHGSGGIRYQSYYLSETLASHGFIVAAPDHTGNTALDVVFGTPDPTEQVALDRPQDVSAVIDRLLARSADPDDIFAGRIDAARIGLTGHSFGGFTSLAATGGYDTVARDPRILAIAPLAPASGLLEDSDLMAVDVPALILGGSADITTPLDPESVRPWELVASVPRYRVDILDAGHQSFTNICAISDALLSTGLPPEAFDFIIGSADEGCAPDLIPIQEAQRITSLYVTAFMKVHVTGERHYRRYLNRGYARSERLPVEFFQPVHGRR